MRKDSIYFLAKSQMSRSIPLEDKYEVSQNEDWKYNIVISFTFGQTQVSRFPFFFFPVVMLS